MNSEEKRLLLIDLCGRLPYGIKARYQNTEFDILGIQGDVVIHKPWCLWGTEYTTCAIEYVKPYLRPMSSMTEEEKEEFEKISHCFLKTIVLKRDKKCRIVEQKAYFDNEIPSSGAFGDRGDYRYINQEYFTNLINWLNTHHFDYRSLIEKGLALEAPEWMYKLYRI